VSEAGDGSRERRRAIVLVIDACGAGALTDAPAYGDEGANTLAHLAEAVGGLRLPVLERLGLGSILALDGVAPASTPAIHGRLHPLGPGKDSITGHWELMGVTLERPLPTYPGGFPPETVRSLVEAMGHEVICNRPNNGLAAIEEFGSEHLHSGALILYTSQDSVLQLAAHVDRIPAEELYEACRRARTTMTGENAVGRVIARPFTGPEGAFVRTEGRRDFAVRPPTRSYLQEIQDTGAEVMGVGKIEDLFGGVGVSRSRPGASNAQALASVSELMQEIDHGLVFVNLIETDQVYGHRKDVEGFHRALREIDAEVGRLLGELREGDLLIVTADHGVDPAHPGTDHTREHVPLLALSGAMLGSGQDASISGGFRHDGPMADVGATVLDWLTGREAKDLPGRSLHLS
jgi:phosphopentomutase